MLVVDDYLYFSCQNGAFEWQNAVFVYDVRTPGHKAAVESIAPPVVTLPYGLAVGP